ncbi:MAG TPA: hypothetical protein VE870_15875 [Bacteroidales bacterium]|nr:hypothetical protein [Bacteroidales bacterium]
MRNRLWAFWAFVLFFAWSCGPNRSKVSNSENSDEGLEAGRLFADNSFWNQPIPDDAETDPHSEYWMELLANDPSCENFGINLKDYTIPIYEVDSTTPTEIVVEVSEKYHQGTSFHGQPVPIPADLEPSPGSDMHVAMIDRERQMAWDMFHVEKLDNGHWGSFTGMKYPLDGPGVFDTADFSIRPGESIHQYGPGRAAGVPIIAGTIMYDEVKKGEINHKLSCALRYVAYQEHVYQPAVWTDGNFKGGIPEGSVIQLDPDLDLLQFNLFPGELAVAHALQKYGAVVVDFAAGSCLYGEGVWYDQDRSWDGVLRDWEGGISDIPVKYYRVIKPAAIQPGGDRIKEFFQKLLHQERTCE